MSGPRRQTRPRLYGAIGAPTTVDKNNPVYVSSFLPRCAETRHCGQRWEWEDRCLLPNMSMSAKSATCNGSNGEPLTEYPSEATASEAARHVWKQHRLDLVPYRCSHCHYWHLSPRSRNTPSDRCSFCTSSSGEPKDSYHSKSDAIRRAVAALPLDSLGE